MARPEQLGKDDVLEFLRSSAREQDVLEILNECNLILHKDELVASKRKRQKQEVQESPSLAL